MPGPVSDSYEGLPICKCGRFKDVHEWPSGLITQLDPPCGGFVEIPFEDSELGQAMDDFLNSGN